MAFTGTPALVKVSDRVFRVTGVTLAADASGTIGFSDKTIAAEVSLDAPEWKPYVNGDGEPVSLQDAVEVAVYITTDVTTPVPVSVVKTGTKHSDFVITLHNDTAATTSPGLEIYVQFH
jgi:hypothetical protein